MRAGFSGALGGRTERTADHIAAHGRSCQRTQHFLRRQRLIPGLADSTVIGCNVRMAHSKSIHRLTEEARAAERAEELRLAPQRKRAEREAKLAVAVFNVRARTQSAILAWPTFRAARAAKRYFLTAFCPGCKQEACLDLRKLSYHPDASINCLIPKLSCKRCCPNPPFAKITGLWRRPR